jgi:apolipoprotein N-acyltransferase
MLGVGAPGMTFTLDAAEAIRRLPWPSQDLTMATPICFEDTVARVCRRMVYEDGRKVAALLVNLSNDGWFGDHDAGRAQHAQIARFRCIENRVPMVRCANTGLSVAIDAAGRVVGRIGEGRYGEGRQAGALEVRVTLDDRTTLYARVRESWSWTCLALTAAAVGLVIRRRPKAGQQRG